MKKLQISKLFLYRHRFRIGYTLLFLAFLSLVIFLPSVAPNGLSQDEMTSVANSLRLSPDSLTSGDVVDLPYRALQKLSIMVLGANIYAIKLPSILIGLVFGLILVLLLNRWFKNNVAVIASVITILSSTFLYLAGSGTPLIMMVFWPTILLWLGSKINNNNHPRPSYFFIMAILLLLALFTPYMIYLVGFIAILTLSNPHLRFTIKGLPKVPLVIISLIIIAGVALFIYNLLPHPDSTATLFFVPDFSIDKFFSNLNVAFLPFFSWSGKVESIFLSPLVNLAALTLAISGLFSAAKNFFASRNSIAVYLIIFALALAGLNPNYAVIILVPLAILIAHGIRYILEKWYGLFPENPYARIFAILPIGALIGIIVITDLSHFIFGYRYNPPVANQFQTDLMLIRKHLPQKSVLLIPKNTPEYNFYKILEPNISIVHKAPTSGPVATLGKWQKRPAKAELNRIITSSKSLNSDRIYLYTVKEEE